MHRENSGKRFSKGSRITYLFKTEVKIALGQKKVVVKNIQFLGKLIFVIYIGVFEYGSNAPWKNKYQYL